MRRLKILIADDESLIRMGLKTILSTLGHEVLTAADGHEALNIFHTRAPDMAILDIRMPFTDGLEAAKAMYRHRPLPILILTAFGEQSLIESAAALPIQGYLIKPVDEVELAAAIEVAAARFDESQVLAREAAELRYDLESRKTVDRAKAWLMAHGRSEEEAYREIQQQARSKRVSMRLAANEVLQSSGAAARKPAG
ncbi:MAG: response regulator [Anaerolineales bacterium]|nr:response regulator [Anaerolineales bacterium]